MEAGNLWARGKPTGADARAINGDAIHDRQGQAPVRGRRIGHWRHHRVLDRSPLEGSTGEGGTVKNRDQGGLPCRGRILHRPEAGIRFKTGRSRRLPRGQ